MNDIIAICASCGWLGLEIELVRKGVDNMSIPSPLISALVKLNKGLHSRRCPSCNSTIILYKTPYQDCIHDEESTQSAAKNYTDTSELDIEFIYDDINEDEDEDDIEDMFDFKSPDFYPKTTPRGLRSLPQVYSITCDLCEEIFESKDEGAHRCVDCLERTMKVVREQEEARQEKENQKENS